MKKYILTALIAGAMLFTAGNLNAESGFLFLEGTQSDRGFKMTARPINGTWRYLPGGFMVNLTGGHRFIYRNLGARRASFQFHRKIGSTMRIYSSTFNTRAGISYGMHGGKRRFMLTRTYHASKKGPNRNVYYQVKFKRGSVLFK